MWKPYVLGAILICITIRESLYAFEDAKKRAYKKRDIDDPPPPPKRILVGIGILVFLVYCLTYAFSAHVAALCMLFYSVIRWLISWKRFKRYKTYVDLLASTTMIIMVAVYAYRFWDLFPM